MIQQLDSWACITEKLKLIIEKLKFIISVNGNIRDSCGDGKVLCLD